MAHQILAQSRKPFKTVRPALDTVSLDILVRAKGKKGFKGKKPRVSFPLGLRRG